MIEETVVKKSSKHPAPKVRLREKPLANKAVSGLEAIKNFGIQYRRDEEQAARDRRDKKRDGDKPWIIPETMHDFNNDFNNDFGW